MLRLGGGRKAGVDEGEAVLLGAAGDLDRRRLTPPLDDSDDLSLSNPAINSRLSDVSSRET